MANISDQLMEVPKLKIAFIGNMNNNHFSIKRYFEDRGFKCDLYLFNTLPKHFLPENDTWEIIKHENSIKNLNRGIPFIDLFKSRPNFDFDKYDICIGSGLTPYYFNKWGLELDIFLPYGSDLYELPFKKEWSVKSLKSFLSSCQHNLLIYKRQHKGILDTKRIFTINHVKSISEALKKLNRISLPFSTPMVYLEESTPSINWNEYLDNEKLQSFKLKVISHSRQSWGYGSKYDSKGNDILINGFNLYAKINPNACLILFEYGPSVEKSKKLIEKLKIEDKIIWVKQMPIKLIYLLIKEHADIGADQFESGYIGATAYELMAHGIPVMSFLNLSSKEFEEKLLRPCPPIININTPNDVSKTIHSIDKKNELYTKLSKQSKNYFDKYLGDGAVDVYIDEILTLHKTKTN